MLTFLSLAGFFIPEVQGPCVSYPDSFITHSQSVSNAHVTPHSICLCRENHHFKKEVTFQNVNLKFGKSLKFLLRAGKMTQWEDTCLQA